MPRFDRPAHDSGVGLTQSLISSGPTRIGDQTTEKLVCTDKFCTLSRNPSESLEEFAASGDRYASVAHSGP
jgi:hypothetical protein